MTEKLEMLIEGEAAGQLIFSSEPLSFWGGVSVETGEVIDRRHPLSGQSLAGKILVFPGSRGSSSGSGVLLEAIRNGSTPAAIISAQPDLILALAALLARELYGRTSPLAVGSATFFEWALQHNHKPFTLHSDGSFDFKDS
ncbi:MAG TPA: DUF126 domain-containing protein [Chloroflexia bacterium]|nr:DUF126 domain-containing protein [Chloroflexia bacterium]